MIHHFQMLTQVSFFLSLLNLFILILSFINWFIEDWSLCFFSFSFHLVLFFSTRLFQSYIHCYEVSELTYIDRVFFIYIYIILLFNIIFLYPELTCADFFFCCYIFFIWITNCLGGSGFGIIFLIFFLCWKESLPSCDKTRAILPIRARLSKTHSQFLFLKNLAWSTNYAPIIKHCS
jgi:hypothetical protein